jgi:hypothetical protein
MTIIRVTVESLRQAAREYDGVIERSDAIISRLQSASAIAGRAEGDFGNRVRDREASVVPLIQRIINDATSARDYLREKADAFEQADLASLAGLRSVAEQMRALIDLGVSVPLMPAWLLRGDCPPGFDKDIWRHLPNEDKQEILGEVRNRWDRWIRQMIASGEIDHATIEEFEDLIIGVRKVWAWDSLSVRVAPGIEAERLGYLTAGQIVNWTGQVRSVDGEEWYEVIYHDRYGREVRGWSWSGRLERYVYVNPEIDPNRGGSYPFDMSEQMASVPFIQEIREAISETGRPQGLSLDEFLENYLDENEKPLTPREDNNDELCGEFVLAAALEEDVLDVLDTWMEHERATAERILINDEETTRTQLQGILDAYGRTYENHDGWMSPAAMQRELEKGRQFVVLVGVNGDGDLVAGHVGHWVLVEDVVPAGNSGWVRVWHSYIPNDPVAIAEGEPIIYEQIYTFEEFEASWGDPGEGNSSRFSGFWIEPEQVTSEDPSIRIELR